MDKFQKGDRVRVRRGAELKLHDRLNLVGVIVETADLPAYGDAIRVHWLDQETPDAHFSDSALFKRVDSDTNGISATEQDNS